MVSSRDGCVATGVWLPSLPLDASREGHRVDALLRLALELTGGLFITVLAVFVFLLWRYRAREGNARAVYDPGESRGHRLAVFAVVGFMLVGVDLALVRVAYADLRAYFGVPPRGEGVLRIEVMPQQFAWNVRYAGRDGRFNTEDDPVLLNELRVPVGAQVVVQLVGKDVIHSFFVPQFRVKQDALPGRITRAWFQPTRVGTYDLVCAELCGFGHYQMRAVVRVLSREEWQRWLARIEQDALRRRVPEDHEARWGWEWRD